jgi:hypothetical protein
LMSSVFGSRNTRVAAEQTVEAARAATIATLTAAREGQRWEREHAAYVETIAGVLRRQRQRRYLVTNSLSEDSDQLRDFLDAHDPPGWLEAQARLIACASEWVKDAAEASRQAHLEVWARVHRYRLMDDDNRLALESGGGGDAPFDGRELVAARRDIDAAIADADAMDNLLVTLIREEQRSNGRTVLAGQ